MSWVAAPDQWQDPNISKTLGIHWFKRGERDEADYQTQASSLILNYLVNLPMAAKNKTLK